VLRCTVLSRAVLCCGAPQVSWYTDDTIVFSSFTLWRISAFNTALTYRLPDGMPTPVLLYNVTYGQ
jgi:hypothetical protein